MNLLFTENDWLNHKKMFRHVSKCKYTVKMKHDFSPVRLVDIETFVMYF